MAAIRARTLLLVAVLAGTAAAAAGSAMAGPRTSAVLYRPFASSGAPAVHVSHLATGYCWTGSIAANRDDAWRCITKNLIYDPCFSSSRAAGIVLCPVIVARRAVVEIKLTRALPVGFGDRRKPSTAGAPWAIETASGLRCIANTGAGTSKDGLESTYFCRHEILWGSVSRRRQPWTIYVAAVGASKLTTKAKIKVAWF